MALPGYSSPIDLALANSPNYKTDDKELYSELVVIYNALKLLRDVVNNAVPVVQAFYTETVAYGALVNLYNVAGVLSARNANATAAGKPAHGWCRNKSGVLANNQDEIVVQGIFPSAAGLTPGSTYFLTNAVGVAGLAAGTVTQRIGYAISATELYVRPDLI